MSRDLFSGCRTVSGEYTNRDYFRKQIILVVFTAAKFIVSLTTPPPLRRRPNKLQQSYFTFIFCANAAPAAIGTVLATIGVAPINPHSDR